MSSSTRPTDSERADLESLHLRRGGVSRGVELLFPGAPRIASCWIVILWQPLRMETLPSVGKFRLAYDRGFI